MSTSEQEKTMRVIAKRNKSRKEALAAAQQQEQEQIDTS